MELHILLAGVEFGPYTEVKARQLLDEGFLSASDPAKRLDETNWLPLSDILAASPVPAGAASAVLRAPAPAFRSLAAALEEHPPADDYHAPLPPGSEIADAPLEEGNLTAPVPEPEPIAPEEQPTPPPPPPARKERLSVTGLRGPAAPDAIAASRVTRAIGPRPSRQPLSSPPPTTPVPSVPTSARSTRKLARIARDEAETPPGTPGRPRTTPVASQEIKSSFAAALAKTRSMTADETAPLPAPARSTSRATPASGSTKSAPEPAPAAAAPTPAPAKGGIRFAAAPRSMVTPVPKPPPSAAANVTSSVRAVALSAAGTAPLTSITTTARAKKPSVTGSLMIKEALIKAREKGAAGPRLPTPPPQPGSVPEPAAPPAPKKIELAKPVEREPEPPAAPAAPISPVRRVIKLTGRIPLPGGETNAPPVERKAFPAPPVQESAVTPAPAAPRPAPIQLRENREAPLTKPKTATSRKAIKLSGPISLPGRLAQTTRPGPLGPVMQATGPIGGVSAPRPPAQPKAEVGSLIHPAETAAAAALAAEALASLTEPETVSGSQPLSSGSLKVTGALRHPPAPRSAIRLSSPSGESGLLPPAAETPAAKPASPVPEEELAIRPASGKIPVHEFPTEGVKVRTRRITAKVPLSETPAESIVQESPARQLPPPLPPRIEPPETESSSETAWPPPGVDEAAAETIPIPLAETGEAAPPAEPEAPAIEARPAPTAPPDKVRLRRPVKLELTSRKTPDSDKLSLEAFSKLSSQEEPVSPPEVGSAEPPLTETKPEVEDRPAAYPGKRLREAPPLTWTTPRRELPQTRAPFPLEWIFYAIIILGLIAGVPAAYLLFHHAKTTAEATTSVTTPAPTVPNAPPASATPPASASPPAETSVTPASPAAVTPPASAVPPAATTATPATLPPPSSPAEDAARQASAFVSDGILKYQHGDFDGAISAYNQALTINPKSTEAFFNRGIAKAAHEDLDGAEADYSQALELDPNMGAAYYYRGLARHSKADLDGAISDYNNAVRIDGKNALAFFNRGLIRMQKDDIDGAIVDSTQALELDPHLIQSYYDRGLGRMAKGAVDSALDDMKTFTQLAPQDAYTDYARLYIWLIQTQQGQLAEANNDLSAAMNTAWNGKSDDMVTRIGEFLLGQISEADLVRASASSIPVKDQGQRCEAWYFIGMRKLEAGDKDGAAEALRKCVDTQKTDYCEFILAQEELRKLMPGDATDSTPPPAPRATPAGLPDPGTVSPPDSAVPAH